MRPRHDESDLPRWAAFRELQRMDSGLWNPKESLRSAFSEAIFGTFWDILADHLLYLCIHAAREGWPLARFPCDL